LPEGDRTDYLECVRDRIKPDLCDATGKWTADDVRLRFAAHLTHLTNRMCSCSHPEQVLDYD
jgi:hypothetical protein